MTLFIIGVRSHIVRKKSGKQSTTNLPYPYGGVHFKTTNEELARRFVDDAKKHPRQTFEPDLQTRDWDSDENFTLGSCDFNTPEEYEVFIKHWVAQQDYAAQFD